MTALFTLALAVAISSPITQIPKGDDVVATVDGVAIRAKDVDKALWDWYSTDVVEEMVVTQMVAGALKREGVMLDQKDVDAFLQRLLDEAKASYPPGTNFEAELKKQGLPKSRLAARAATEVGLRQLTEARFKPADFRKVAWLMIKPAAAGADQMAAARKNADEALDLLKTTPWAEVVKARSHDKNSALREGELGWFAVNELPADVGDAMKPLASGAHTGVLESQGVLSIYRVVAVGPPPAAELEAVKASFVARNLSKVFQEIRTKAKIERKGV
ncbi:MAG: peptidylprolyl isomerase [Armatimonadota bacterium]|nr:peptidylprolyl isomerase [Armatimonadota bacterium]